MRNRATIESILIEDLAHARSAFETAKAHFRITMSDIPSGLPAPDGAATIRDAGKSYHSAMNTYAVALHQFNAFILDGTIPERLKDSG